MSAIKAWAEQNNFWENLNSFDFVSDKPDARMESLKASLEMAEDSLKMALRDCKDALEAIHQYKMTGGTK